MTLVDALRRGLLDAELGALLWLVAERGVPVHVAATDASGADPLAAALRAVARGPAAVSVGTGAALEDVLRQPVPLRPATGVVVILDAAGRVAVAHFQRPPLRDAGGHVRPQGPAVLAVRDDRIGGWEHFAWGVLPDLAAASGQRPGDLEIEQGRRAEFLAALVASRLDDPSAQQRALSGYLLERGSGLQ